MSPTTTLSLLQGTADLLILRALQGGAAHGYAISRWVRERTDGVLTIEDAALYQALHRLEARGWIEAEWGLSENNRKAKYYALTRRRPSAGQERNLDLEKVRGSGIQSHRTDLIEPAGADADDTSNPATECKTPVPLRPVAHRTTCATTCRKNSRFTSRCAWTTS